MSGREKGGGGRGGGMLLRGGEHTKKLNGVGCTWQYIVSFGSDVIEGPLSHYHHDGHPCMYILSVFPSL
jgi:hypothetical protein